MLEYKSPAFISFDNVELDAISAKSCKGGKTGTSCTDGGTGLTCVSSAQAGIRCTGEGSIGADCVGESTSAECLGGCQAVNCRVGIGTSDRVKEG